MNLLSLRFITIEHKFSYRLAFEITLIVFILIAVSGIINGISGQFSTFLLGSSNIGSNQYYLAVEQGKTLEDSKIPYQIIDYVDQSFLDYFLPILVFPINFNHSYSVNYFFTYIKSASSNPSFLITVGSLPIHQSEILIGEGLATQLGITDKVGQTVVFKLNNYTFTRTIVGIFEDNNPWYYGILDDFSNYWSNLSYISGFEFQIKNSLVLPVFEQKIGSSITNSNLGVTLDFINLEQKEQLSVSFYNDLYRLFNYLLILLSLLLFLKLFHSSYTLLKRLQPELWICKLVGMNDFQLFFLFWQAIAFIGNIGILFGIFLGLFTPTLFLFGIKIILINSTLSIVPSLNDIIIIIIIANFQFLLISILTTQLNKRVKVNELF